MDSVAELVKRKRIIGCPPSLEDLVNPAEEQEIGDSPYKFEGGDAEIVAEVRHEMAVERGEIIDDKDESDDEDDADVPSCQEVTCAKWAAASHGRSEASPLLSLPPLFYSFPLHLSFVIYIHVSFTSLLVRKLPLLLVFPDRCSMCLNCSPLPHMLHLPLSLCHHDTTFSPSLI